MFELLLPSQGCAVIDSSLRFFSVFGTAMKSCYRLLDPVFPLAQLRDGDDCFNMAQQLFARRVSYLRSESLRKSCLFGFWFRYMRKAQHTVFGKVDREYHRWLPNPLFQDLFQDLPSPNVCLWRSTVLLGFVLDWMPSRQPCWVGGRDRESADSHDEKSGVCYGLLQT